MAFMLIYLYNKFIKPYIEENTILPIIIQPDIENNLNHPITIEYQSVIEKSCEFDSSIPVGL